MASKKRMMKPNEVESFVWWQDQVLSHEKDDWSEEVKVIKAENAKIWLSLEVFTMVFSRTKNANAK